MIRNLQFKSKKFDLEGIKGFIHDALSPVLSDKNIMSMNKDGILLEYPLTEHQVQPNSVDLTLASTWKKIKPNGTWGDGTPFIDVEKPMIYESGEFHQRTIVHTNTPIGRAYYLLEPGEFVLMASKEVLHIPNGILAFVQGRSSIARIGIQTEQAGLIDAGFHGTITFEVYNEGPVPVKLVEGMRVAQLYFYKAQRAARPYGSPQRGSKYQLQIEATGSRIHEDPELRGGKR